MEHIKYAVFEKLAAEEMPSLRPSLGITRADACAEAEIDEDRKFKWLNSIEDRLVGGVAMTAGERSEWLERLEKGHKFKRAAFIRGKSSFVPYVTACTGKQVKVFGISRYLVAALFADYLAEYLRDKWDHGFFRYAWAERDSTHEKFNCTLSIRAANRGTWIDGLAHLIAGIAITQCGRREWSSPELKALIEKVKSGKAVIDCKSGAGRPKGSKNKSVARLNAQYESHILQLSKEVGAAQQDIVKLVKDVEFEREINIKQTQNIQTLLEKLNELANAYNKLLKVHRVFADENGTIHAEHQPWQVLNGPSKETKCLTPEEMEIINEDSKKILRANPDEKNIKEQFEESAGTDVVVEVAKKFMRQETERAVRKHVMEKLTREPASETKSGKGVFI